MPTKPSRKHGKDFLDEAVAKSTYRKKELTRNRVIFAGILAFPLGSTGIHNFLMRNKKRGLIHLLYSSTTFGMFFIPMVYGLAVLYRCTHKMGCEDISDYDDTLNAILIAGLILFCISIIWGAVEGVIILLHRNRYPITPNKKQ